MLYHHRKPSPAQISQSKEGLDVPPSVPTNDHLPGVGGQFTLQCKVSDERDSPIENLVSAQTGTKTIHGYSGQLPGQPISYRPDASSLPPHIVASTIKGLVISNTSHDESAGRISDSSFTSRSSQGDANGQEKHSQQDIRRTDLDQDSVGVKSDGSRKRKRQSNKKPKNVMGHLPDLFYGHKQNEYAAYVFDCAKNKDRSDFLKNILAKHWTAGDFHDEFGSDEEAKRRYLAVLEARPEHSDDDIAWYKAWRKALWGTPLEVAIVKCPNDGQHKLCIVQARKSRFPPMKKPKKTLLAALKSSETASSSAAAALTSSQLVDDLRNSCPQTSTPLESTSTLTLEQQVEFWKTRATTLEHDLVQTHQDRAAFAYQGSFSPSASNLSAASNVPGKTVIPYHNPIPSDLGGRPSPTPSDATSTMSSYFLSNGYSSAPNMEGLEYTSGE